MITKNAAQALLAPELENALVDITKVTKPLEKFSQEELVETCLRLELLPGKTRSAKKLLRRLHELVDSFPLPKPQKTCASLEARENAITAGMFPRFA
jgi:hypothetical protein